MIRLTAVVLFVHLVVSSAQAQSVVFVDIDAAGVNDGTSWADAFNALSDGLSAATAGDHVWIAEGVYLPDKGVGVTDGDTTSTFLIRGGVSLFGGFVGTETSLVDRDLKTAVTILSGDLDRNDVDSTIAGHPSRTDNTLPVVTFERDSRPSRLDGLVVENGGGNREQDAHGGCLRASFDDSDAGTIHLQDVDVRGCIGSSGGGAWLSHSNTRLNRVSFEYNHGEQASAILHNRGTFRADSSDFVGNTGRIGGALWLDRGVDTLSNVVFRANKAKFNTGLHNQKGDVYIANAWFIDNEGQGPTAIFTDEGTTIVVNSVFSRNVGLPQTDQVPNGSLISVFESDVSITNSTIAYNSGDALVEFRNGAANTIANTIVWSNDSTLFLDPGSGTVVVSHSNIEGGTPDFYVDGGSNIDADPMFASETDLSLTEGSPSIDTGLNDLLPNDFADLNGNGDYLEPTPIDLLGAVRVFEPGSGKAAIVDMGAYEFDAPLSTHADSDIPRDQAFALYPNPARTWATVQFHRGALVRAILEVFDVTGRLVHSTAVVGTQRVIDLDVSGYPAGVYLIRVDGREATTSTLTVMR